MSYEEKVQRGAALLDKLIPDWEQRIDLLTLDIGSCTECILGQLLENYFYADELDNELGSSTMREACGLISTAKENYLLEAGILTQAWTDEIVARRSR